LVIGSHISNHTSLSASFFSQNTKVQFLYLFFPDLSESNAGNRIFLGHRIEFRPLAWARFSISENIMANADNLSPQYLDPTVYLSQYLQPRPSQLIASIEADIALQRACPSMDRFASTNTSSLLRSGNGKCHGILGRPHLRLSQDKGNWTALAEVVSVEPCHSTEEKKVDFLVARESYEA
jgi:hypothetical protein